MVSTATNTKGPITRSKTTNSIRLEMQKIAQGNKKYIDMQTLKNIADHLYPLAGNTGYIPGKYDRKDLKVKVTSLSTPGIKWKVFQKVVCLWLRKSAMQLRVSNSRYLPSVALLHMHIGAEPCWVAYTERKALV